MEPPRLAGFVKAGPHRRSTYCSQTPRPATQAAVGHECWISFGVAGTCGCSGDVRQRSAAASTSSLGIKCANRLHVGFDPLFEAVARVLVACNDPSSSVGFRRIKKRAFY